MNSAYLHIDSLEEYLALNGDFIADDLRDKLNDIYIESKQIAKGQELFWNIVDRVSPRNEKVFQETAMVIMAKYFETCDIFEEPSKE